jgi:hypothetical protein
MSGDFDAARASYETAAQLTTSVPEQRYLEARAARVAASQAPAATAPDS